MLGNMLNDLAEAIRRWTGKKTFIDVVKLDYGKVSASDLSGLEIALVFLSCKRRFEMLTCGSKWIYLDLDSPLNTVEALAL